MTTITSATDTASAASATGASSKLNADFNMFLRLLTAQMQNQDPLDPMDTAQYTQQLVQYSQVEQSISQNATLKSILATLGTQDLTRASSLIGQDVRIDTATSGLGSAPAQWNWSADRQVGTINATIRNASGKVVETHTIDANSTTGDLAWDGTLSNGGKAPAGSYTLELEATDTSGNSVPVAIQSRGVVTGVEFSGGAAQIVVGGVRIPLTDITAIGG